MSAPALILPALPGLAVMAVLLAWPRRPAWQVPGFAVGAASAGYGVAASAATHELLALAGFAVLMAVALIGSALAAPPAGKGDGQ